MHWFLVPALVSWSAIASATPPKVEKAVKTRATLGRLGLQPARGPFKPSASKDETYDLRPGSREVFRTWQQSARRELVVNGRRVPVTVIEVGSDAQPKPTILHFHGASVGPDDILFYRLANGFKATGKPVRIISAEWNDAAKVLDHLHRTTGQKVAVMGHSAGGHVADFLARNHGDKVSHLVSLDVGGIPTNVPSLLVVGSESSVKTYPRWRTLLRKNLIEGKRADGVVFDTADFALRARTPATLHAFDAETKALLNDSSDSARVATSVAQAIHRFLDGKRLSKGFLRQLKAEPLR